MGRTRRKTVIPLVRALARIDEASHTLRALEPEDAGADGSLREALRLLDEAHDAAARVETERDPGAEWTHQLEAVWVGRALAHERFKLDSTSRNAAGLTLAVLIHAGALAFLPGLRAPDLRTRDEALLALDLPERPLSRPIRFSCTHPV